MSKLILQNIAENISFDSLPMVWQSFDLKRFSNEKTLYDFQQDALKNALKILWKYYEDIADYHENERLEINQKRKEQLFNLYSSDPNFPEKGADYDLSKKEGKKTAKLFEEYYPTRENKVGFENFINRMAFWMATGSGKTLVIVKLIEILKKLIEAKEIPANDILFLTHREDLIEQFKEHIKEFNGSAKNIFINLRSLKDYNTIKRETPSLFKDREITIFYYRSDLILDEQKEKIVDFKNYDNNGKWYIILDEAHKGDQEESKRQVIYSILSRNGFLFNFSATFTDPRDFLTTVFNFNLQEFIEAGYGKYIYLSQEEIKAFREKGKKDFSEKEKQKIVLKSLILLSYIRKFADKIKSIKKNLYHYPLLLTLVNSVNVEDADLKLFFKEIEKIGKGEVDEDIFESVKKEIIEQFEIDKKILIPKGIEFEIDKKLLESITFQDILEDVFNSKSPGNIEVLTIPGNKQEMVFKLRTSEKPFALIKIGDIKPWLDWFEDLGGYEINETFDNESVFRKINRDDSDINILMGSRSFYEGWDSNRPNIILFINIGSKDAKKFVLQSTGRGVRIEPIKNERKRLQNLYVAKKINRNIYEKIKKYILPVETLFIFGTNAKALEEVIKTFEEVRGKEYPLTTHFKINKKAEKLPLFVPVYKPASYILADAREPKSYVLGKDEFNLVKNYFEYFDDKRVILVKYETEPKIIQTLQKSFNEPLNYYKFEQTTAISNPELILSRIIDHFSLIPEEFKGFHRVERGKFIVHFEKIRFTPEKGKELNNLLEYLEKVKRYEERDNRLKQLRLDFQKHKNIEKYDREKERLEKEYPRSLPFDGIEIKYVSNHYYYPVILSETKHKIDYLNHIITEESEVKFIKELEEYLTREDNLFNKRFEWWLFSKLDETTDDVYIPWYNPKTNKINKFKPDFIFWLKEKGNNNYYIVFIDPKGTEHTEAYRKIDGFKSLFYGRSFDHDEFNIKVKLFCKPEDKAYAIEEYKEFWFDNMHKILERI